MRGGRPAQPHDGRASRRRRRRTAACCGHSHSGRAGSAWPASHVGQRRSSWHLRPEAHSCCSPAPLLAPRGAGAAQIGAQAQPRPARRLPRHRTSAPLARSAAQAQAQQGQQPLVGCRHACISHTRPKAASTALTFVYFLFFNNGSKIRPHLPNGRT